MKANIVTDYDIQALVDDEIGHEDAKRVHKHLKRNPTAQRRYDELLKQKKLLKQWWFDTRNTQ